MVRGLASNAPATTTRGIPRHFATSTLLYSGVFAAATTLDVKSKRERREQWDQAIADIKEELDQPDDAQNSIQRQKDARLLQDGFLVPEITPDSQIAEFGSYLDSSPLRRSKAWSPKSTNSMWDGRHLSPQSLFVRTERKERYLTQPWTKVKLERVRLCMDKFQLDIINEIQRAGLAENAAAHVEFEYAQHIGLPLDRRRAQAHQKLADIARLRVHKGDDLEGWKRSTHDVPLSAYEMDKDGHFVERARDLNQTLQVLFRRRARAKISRAELLAKVAESLSVSPAPPNIDTFNTLIVGFAQLHEKRLFDAATLALSHTRVRPNEVTLASIFKYDAETMDFAHFRTWLERLRGKGIGLCAARKDLTINDDNRARLRPRPDSDSGAILQLPHPTPMVFNALIGAMVRFYGFDTALQVCRGMSDEGWGLSMAGLRPLLQDSVERADWGAGMIIWNKILELRTKSRKRMRWGWNQNSLRWMWRSEKIHLPSYITMFQLCKRCNQKEMFETLVADAVREHKVTIGQLMSMMNIRQPAGQVTEGNPHQKNDGSRDKQDVRDSSPSQHLSHSHRNKNRLLQRQYVHLADQRTNSFVHNPANTIVDQDQLHGLSSGNQYLDEYESAERPMSMYS